MSGELKIPAIGESIAEVYIGQWHKAEGDVVREGDVVVEIESDKAMMELPAPHSGTLKQILKQEGDEVAVGDTIAILEPGEVPAEPKTPTAAPAAEAPASAAAPAAEPAAADGPVMPAAQRLAQQHDVDPTTVAPTGPGGRVLKEDVQRHVAAADTPTPSAPSTPPATPEPTPGARTERRVRMTPIRRRIAQRLVDAQQTAALLTTFNDVDMTHVMNLRRKHQDAFTEKHGVRLGFMSFFVKAAVDALQLVPEVNAYIEDNEIVYHDYMDIGIAVGGGRGLVVPVLRNAETMSFAQIEQSIADYARRAQTNELSVDELQGGTFTISNGGVYGSLLSTPIVNPPQSGILGLHRIEQRPVVVDGEVVVRNMMYLALTYDHRIIDGREAVTFLQRIKHTIEEPERMLLEV